MNLKHDIRVCADQLSLIVAPRDGEIARFVAKQQFAPRKHTLTRPPDSSLCKGWDQEPIAFESLEVTGTWWPNERIHMMNNGTLVNPELSRPNPAILAQSEGTDHECIGNVSAGGNLISRNTK